ncbi:uncharacterized protein [Physcomitrium patens]|uniref:uncharacterized protein isoform X2 n=1 Tax=Physcomitrium patens TaxID=3218 RepID=UPI003CCD7CAB
MRWLTNFVIWFASSVLSNVCCFYSHVAILGAWLIRFITKNETVGDMLGVPIKGDSRYDLKYILIDTATFAASPFISDKMTLPL